VTAAFATIEARSQMSGSAAAEDPASRDLLARLMAGEPIPPGRLAAHDPARLMAAADREGALPLASDQLGRIPDAPPELTAAFAAAAFRHAAADLVREVELVRLVAGLADAGVVPLFMKGAQLAYTHYPRPDLRPRFDTDLIVARSDRASAHRRLLAMGYEPVEQMTGDLVMYQTVYVAKRDGVPVHAIDLHWRLANPQRFGAVLTHGEMAASAVPIARLGDRARGLSQAHALLVACIHPAAHHRHAQRLIWQYDVHLLASRLTPADWDGFAALAVERQVAGVCRRTLDLARERFGALIPESTLGRLAAGPADRATAAYLSPGRRQIQDAVADFRALPTWSDRLRLVGQHLFPSAHYMRDVYAPSSAAPLPVLYARRALRGARRWLTRS
jgi:hypothetical protein